MVALILFLLDRSSLQKKTFYSETLHFLPWAYSLNSRINGYSMMRARHSLLIIYYSPKLFALHSLVSEQNRTCHCRMAEDYCFRCLIQQSVTPNPPSSQTSALRFVTGPSALKLFCNPGVNVSSVQIHSPAHIEKLKHQHQHLYLYEPAMP